MIHDHSCMKDLKPKILQMTSNRRPGIQFLKNSVNTYFTSVDPTALLLQCNWAITGI